LDSSIIHYNYLSPKHKSTNKIGYDHAAGCSRCLCIW